ncbi:Flavodoxin [Cryobacterium psychrotolerans]|uniref:Flavodoxin n=1 Tax=Cryobacterium psychrotolerans TaxID=386301 RepID=A0A1G9HPS6_9MICO|nr:flavodoxin domain-containing protein [Cryobacterium psychrotolerans]TFD91531.1 flavodoxin family protein [Cryobacterium psychrotolerans]SDL14968.1 Flavodoxin [Cryobacterium psychrotolerans]
MRALVVYESLWGNTEKVARAVAAGLAGIATVDVLNSDAAPVKVDGYDLVVVGGPTHAFSMTRATTRAEAVKSHSAPHEPARGIREWLNELDRPVTAIPAIAFDTRVDKPRLPGSAAKSAKHELRSLGFETSVKQETFRVHGYEGPLLDGELERARAWADEVIATLGLNS